MAKIKKYSVKEAAAMLGVDPQRLYRLALEDTVPHQQMGLDVWFTNDNIDLLRLSIQRLLSSDSGSST